MNTEPINNINIGFKPVNSIKIGFNVGGTSDRPPYEGEYEVTPKTYNEQVLPTKNKRMIDNLTVKKIPQYEVSNNSGYTLIIGEESLNG